MSSKAKYVYRILTKDNKVVTTRSRKSVWLTLNGLKTALKHDNSYNIFHRGCKIVKYKMADPEEVEVIK